MGRNAKHSVDLENSLTTIALGVHECLGLYNNILAVCALPGQFQNLR